MKINEATHNVRRSADFREQGFKIAATAQAFDILSSKLYSDVPLAVVRELSTNASDAHVEAGNADKPFDVQLPNAFDQFFVIRDYGTGLNEEQMEEIYTVYFCSTRNQSNDYTGAMGLGSKSPFALTDQFTVTSYFDGKATIYSLFKNESGAPAIAKMSESDTSEPNGLEIRIPVREHDIHRFVESARKVYTFFKTRPNIKGAKIDFADLNPAFEGDDYMVFTDRHDLGRVNVVMGQICYAANGISSRSFAHGVQVVVHVPIGSCTISASREELQYDDKTQAYLEEVLNKAAKNVREECEALVEDQPTKLKRIQALQKYRNIIAFAHDDKVTIPTVEKDAYSLRHVEVRRSYRSSGGNGRLYIDQAIRHDRMHPSAEKTYVFIHEDEELKPKHKRRIKHWIEQNHPMRGSVIIYLCQIEDDAKFGETFGEISIKLSEIPKAPINRSGSSGVRQYVKHLARTNRSRISDEWVGMTEDMPDNVELYYVPRRGNYAVFNGHDHRPASIRRMAVFLGINPEHVYGVSTRSAEKLSKKYGMQCLFTAAEAEVKKRVAALTDDQAILLHHERPRLHARLMKEAAGVSDLVDTIIRLQDTKITDPSDLRNLANYFKVELPSANNPMDEFRTRYPLILKVSIYDRDDADLLIPHLIEHMRSVEANATENKQS